jgi:hypothetical protein
MQMGNAGMKRRGGAFLALAVICGAAATSGAAAQDQEIYDAIDCSQWSLNPDGTWNTGPKATILYARRNVANAKHLDLTGFYVEGVDVSAWLAAKCGKNENGNRLFPF